MQNFEILYENVIANDESFTPEMHFLEIVLPTHKEDIYVDDVLREWEITPEDLDIQTAIRIWAEEDNEGFYNSTQEDIREYLKQAGVEDTEDVWEMHEIQELPEDRFDAMIGGDY